MDIDKSKELLFCNGRGGEVFILIKYLYFFKFCFGNFGICINVMLGIS